MVNEQIKFDLDTKQSLVVQSNSFAMARYDMSTLEQKMFLILLSTISKSDDCFKQTTFRVIDIAKIMDIHPNVLYRDLKKICKNLLSKVYEVSNSNGDWELINIIGYAKYEGKYGIVTFKLNEQAKPYLLQLKEYFFGFKLDNVLLLDGKYSIRLYQQAKSHLNLKSYTIYVDEFINELRLTQKSYSKYGNIKAKIIEPSLKEINSKTDINVSYEDIKLGKKVIAIKFYVKSKIHNQQKVIVKKSNKDGFNNFKSREYYYKELERKLLGWDDIDDKNPTCLK